MFLPFPTYLMTNWEKYNLQKFFLPITEEVNKITTNAEYGLITSNSY